MLYTVAEVSKLTNLSKVSIYKKLKLKELENHVTKEAGITYVDDTALKFITDGLKFNEEFKQDDKEEFKDSDTENISNDEIPTSFDDLTINRELVKTLIDQLKAKDDQINDLHKLLENSQVLLKNEQDKPKEDLLLLEEHLKEFDDRLMNIKERMEKRKEEPKSIFQRIFHKQY